MKRITKNSTIVRKFESVTELHRYIENGKVQTYFENDQTSQAENGKRFTGTENYQEAENLLLYGDRESADKINRDSLNKIRSDIKKYMLRRQYYTSPVGFAVNVPAFLAGTPNNMINMKVTKQAKKVMTVVYSDTANYTIPSEEISKTAAKVFAALMIIEAKGIQINFYSSVTSYKKEQKIGMFVRVKKAGHRFDVLRMTYPCVNPSWLRRHFLRFVEVTPNVGIKFVNSYGCVCGKNDTEELAKEAKINADAVLTFEQCRYLDIDAIIKLITNGEGAK